MLRIAGGLYALTFHEPAEKRLPVMIQFMGAAVLKVIHNGLQLFPYPPRLRKRRPVARPASVEEETVSGQ